jgi:hypothetical protein
MNAGPCPEMDRVSRLRSTIALAEEATDVLHRSGCGVVPVPARESKESVKSSSPRPGRCSGVERMVRVGKVAGVLVGGNQRMVGVGVSVPGMGVGVRVGAGNRPLQAVRKTSRRVPW